MTSRELNKFLSDRLTVDEFKTSIVDEVENYIRLMTQKGSTIPLRFNEDEEITLDKLRFKKLLEFVVAGQLSNIHLAYICDCLTLADNVEINEEIKDFVFEIASPEINGGYFDKERLTEMVSKIKHK